MTSAEYEKISAPFRKEGRVKRLKAANTLLTLVGFVSYPAILAYLYFTAREKLLAAIAVPALGFMLLTAVRRKINRPRPYQALDIKPLISKDKEGKSMPSRHVFSITIIAVTAFLASPYLCGGLLLCSICLAVIRVIGGIHYPSDVAAGVLCAVLWGVLRYSIIL